MDLRQFVSLDSVTVIKPEQAGYLE